MIAIYPNQHPNTILTLSAHADINRENNRTPDLTRLAVRRLLDTRRRVEARIWVARSEVIVRQLRVMRGTW